MKALMPTVLPVIRGDDAAFAVAVFDDDEAALDLTGTTLDFVAKWRVNDAEAVIEKTTGDGIDHADQASAKGRADLRLDAIDTIHFVHPTVLLYSLRIRDATGRQQTIARGRIEIELVPLGVEGS